MKYFIFIFIAVAFSYSPPTYADTCIDGTVRIPGYKKTRIEKSHYCYTEEGAFYSSSCKDLKTCVSNLNEVSKEDTRTFGYGTPGSRLCLALKGQSQVIEYKKADKKTWVKTSRCVFENKSFVDNEILLKSLESTFPL